MCVCVCVCACVCVRMFACFADYYTPYEGLNLANQAGQKLGVFSRKLKGTHFLFYCYFDKN